MDFHKFRNRKQFKRACFIVVVVAVLVWGFPKAFLSANSSDGFTKGICLPTFQVAVVRQPHVRRYAILLILI